MKLQNLALATFLFVACIGLGVASSLKSWNGMVYWYPDNDQRVPAAIKKVFDFSHLEGHALEMASYKRLISDARIIKTKSKIGVQLGHFVMKDFNHKKKFACDIYNKVHLEFVSADMSVNGSPSVMTVTTACLADKDLNKINTIWIPMNKILAEPKRDFEIEYMDDGKVDLKFSNIGDQWPQAWTLNSIRLYSDTNFNQKLFLNDSQMRDIINRPITFYWQNHHIK